VETGVYSIQEALKIAEDQHLDLVESCTLTPFPRFVVLLISEVYLSKEKKRKKNKKPTASKIIP
jgi:translation initiation factor IF-3